LGVPYYRRNLYVLSTTMFVAAVSWNQVVPFLPNFIKEMGVGRELLGWVGVVYSAQAIASIVAQPFWGRLGDRFGRKPMTVRAGICLTGIYLGMSYCQTPLQLAIFRLLNGALTGFIPGSIALIATNTPSELAPRSVATAQSATAVGGILGPVIGGALALLVGYRGTMVISGVAVAVSTLLVWLLVEEPNKPKPNPHSSLTGDFARSMRSRVMRGMMITLLLHTAYFSAVTSILVLYLRDLAPGAPEWLHGVIFALPGLAFAATARAWSRRGEQMGFERTMVIGMIGGVVCGLALAFAPNIWVFAVIFLASSVFLASVQPSTMGVLCTRIDEDFRGAAYGMYGSASMMGALISPIAGTQIGKLLGLKWVFVFGAALLATGILLLPIVQGKAEK
jgi:DHA1 family multidrug resistance protein-like MFS transporter